VRHLEYPILTLVGRLRTLQQMLEKSPDDKRLQNSVNQHNHAIEVLKKHEERK